jgi:hypothetical protein
MTYLIQKHKHPIETTTKRKRKEKQKQNKGHPHYRFFRLGIKNDKERATMLVIRKKYTRQTQNR